MLDVNKEKPLSRPELNWGNGFEIHEIFNSQLYKLNSCIDFFCNELNNEFSFNSIKKIGQGWVRLPDLVGKSE